MKVPPTSSQASLAEVERALREVNQQHRASHTGARNAVSDAIVNVKVLGFGSDRGRNEKKALAKANAYDSRLRNQDGFDEGSVRTLQSLTREAAAQEAGDGRLKHRVGAIASAGAALAVSASGASVGTLVAATAAVVGTRALAEGSPYTPKRALMDTVATAGGMAVGAGVGKLTVTHLSPYVNSMFPAGQTALSQLLSRAARTGVIGMFAGSAANGFANAVRSTVKAPGSLTSRLHSGASGFAVGSLEGAALGAILGAGLSGTASAIVESGRRSAREGELGPLLERAGTLSMGQKAADAADTPGTLGTRAALSTAVSPSAPQKKKGLLSRG